MALGASAAVVIGTFPLGESDRVVTLYSREWGKVRGVARAARRMRSRFAGALELFTLGRAVIFDTGRSELVQIDHFDITRPFGGIRDDLERLGQASWMVECLTRLTGERDRQVGLYALLVRSLAAMETTERPARVAVCFGVRCLEALGHRPRLDRCTVCGRRYPFARPYLGAGGVECEGCARATRDAEPLSPASIAALERLRRVRWEEAIASSLGRLEGELKRALESHMVRLIGQPTRTTRFLRAVAPGAAEAGPSRWTIDLDRGTRG
jgi:DNA repair protein RecO (recombination protein O)